MANDLQGVSKFTSQYVESITKTITSAIKSHSDEIVKAAASKFIPELQSTLENKFKQIVKDYYDAYTPKYYDRRYTMYNVLKFNTDLSNATISWDFDPSEMPYSHGGGGAFDGFDTLFTKAFVEGWHGGAMSISRDAEGKYGEHPSPGTPYYRTGQGYTRWGHVAAKSASPLDEFNAYWDTNHKMFEDMFQRYAQAEFDEKVPAIIQSLNL